MLFSAQLQRRKSVEAPLNWLAKRSLPVQEKHGKMFLHGSYELKFNASTTKGGFFTIPKLSVIRGKILSMQLLLRHRMTVGGG